MSVALHWFRRDLRIAGNPALQLNLKESQGAVLGVFFFDSAFLSRPDFSFNRFGFFLETLKALKADLQSRGGDLLVLDRRPKEGFEFLLKKIKVSRVTFNRDYEPFSRKRDPEITSLLEGHGVQVHTERDHLLIEPNEITKESGGFYQVFTPFSKKWYEVFRTPQVQKRIEDSSNGAHAKFTLNWAQVLGKEAASLDRLDDFIVKNKKSVTISLPKAGEKAALSALQLFSKKTADYKNLRDIPSAEGTSHLAMYLKNGSLSVAQVIRALGLERNTFLSKTSENAFLRQLVWREFYYHVLYHRPSVEVEAFLEKYRNIEWENNLEHFEAWKNGMTGYPLVDAGMRELNQTGFMHNRVRMVVASFLTKHLLIDWRWGEKYFMEKLLDGDLAANNGGWQWAASTGCDPQPYFRVFNPTLQSEKFDPKGEYIKCFVPELKSLSPKQIHSPSGHLGVGGYPAPIVEHASARIRAIRRYS